MPRRKSKFWPHFEAETGRVQSEYDAIQEEVTARFEGSKKNLERQTTEKRWEIMAMSEAAERLEPATQGDRRRIGARWRALQEIHREAVELLRRRGQWRDFPEPQFQGLVLETDPAQRFTRALDLARRSTKPWTGSSYRGSFRAFFKGCGRWGFFCCFGRRRCTRRPCGLAGAIGDGRR